MPDNDFFNKQKNASAVKSNIVKKYFWTWAKVIMPRTRDRIAYIDLYSGQGLYDDGGKSTPILVLENALRDEDMKKKLITIFNDANPKFVECLKKVIKEIPEINELKYPPRVNNETVGSDLVNQMKEMSLVPTLLFVDPWGYKGLTLELIGSVLKDWGCDCIFFFNYVRINMGFHNKKFNDHINAIFGEARAISMRKNLETIYTKPKEREKYILENLQEALQEIKGKFSLSFRFIRGTRTSHYLIFVTKNVLGYDLMKKIMASESSEHHQGVATFEHNPSIDLRFDLFPEEPIEDLKSELLKKYHKCKMTVKELYFKHSIGTPYIPENYKRALIELEAENKITVDPPVTERKKYRGSPTMGDDIQIFFSV